MPDESGERAHVCGLLGMPLHPEHEPPVRILDGLRHAVLGPSGHR